MIPFSDADVQHRSFPVVNLFLIGLSALVFLYELQVGGFGLLSGGGGDHVTAFFFKWGFIPNELSQGVACTYHLVGASNLCPALPPGFLESPYADLPVVPLERGLSLVNAGTPLPTWTTIFSSMFIHGGFLHFAGNMAFLWVFGNNIEDRLGHVQYLLFYLLAGVIAAMGHLAVDPHSGSPLVGASGAIAGVMGAYLLLYPYNRIRALVVFYFITVIQLKALYFLGIWFFLQIINSVLALGMSAQVNVAFMAHVGGFLGGVVIIAAYKLLTGQPIWPSRRRRQPWDYWYRSGRGSG